MKQDPWHYSRGELATHLLRVMDSGLVSRIAIFAPRRKGKTWFVLRDLAPAAVQQAYIPVFASLWRTPEKPQVAIVEGVRTATEVIRKKRVPWTNYLAKLASLGINLGGVGGTVGLARAKKPTSEELSALSESLNELVETAGRKKRRVLLLIDEAQHLATRQAFEAIAKALRTALEGVEATSPEAIRTLFTGSSKTDLAALIDRRNAAFYGSFEKQELPDLTRDYTNFLASQLERLGDISISADGLWDIFATFDKTPYYMQLVIRELMLRRVETLDEAHRLVMEDIIYNPELEARWGGLKPLEKAVYLRVCNNKPLYSANAIAELRRELNGSLEASNVQSVVRRVSSKGLISSEGRGVYRNEDPELLAWVSQQELP